MFQIKEVFYGALYWSMDVEVQEKIKPIAVAFFIGHSITCRLSLHEVVCEDLLSVRIS